MHVTADLAVGCAGVSGVIYIPSICIDYVYVGYGRAYGRLDVQHAIIELVIRLRFVHCIAFHTSNKQTY